LPAWKVELPLVAAGGEPVDLWRTLNSHGVADLPPSLIDEDARTLDVTLAAGRGRPRTIRVEQGRPGHARITAAGAPPAPAQREVLVAKVAHMLRLDEDLSGFYALAARDPELAWATNGAGRMLRSATVFEDVVKTIATTNCTWSATVRMVSALVEHLGERAPSAPAAGPYGRAFPSPSAMAEADEGFFRDIVRAGYRGPYFRSLAAFVAGGELDLEELAGDADLTDEEVQAKLLALPGVGPYAAAHVMMLLGRYSRLILDSWTRPKFASLNGGKAVKDTTIERRFRPYGRYAGLAFWLYLTRDWVPD
jgi:3-methyladenine DNA glycosylase/8-oxoguanine DNA glycosylase